MCSLVFWACQMCFVYSAFSPERGEEVANRLPRFSHLHFKLTVCVLELWRPVDFRRSLVLVQVGKQNTCRSWEIVKCIFHSKVNGSPGTAACSLPLLAFGSLVCCWRGDVWVDGRWWDGDHKDLLGSNVGAVNQKPCNMQQKAPAWLKRFVRLIPLAGDHVLVPQENCWPLCCQSHHLGFDLVTSLGLPVTVRVCGVDAQLLSSTCWRLLTWLTLAPLRWREGARMVRFAGSEVN